jgi:predicted transcriptional regulator
MSESINQRVNRLADGIDRQELAFILQSILTDLTALKTAMNAHTHGGIWCRQR